MFGVFIDITQSLFQHQLRAMKRTFTQFLHMSFLYVLSSLSTPPQNEQMLPFMQRLDQEFRGYIFRGADLFNRIQNQRYLFWLNTGELPETLEHIVDQITCTLSRITWCGTVRQRRRNILNTKNEVLLTFIWLRKYICIDRFHSRDRWPQWGGETIRNI